MKFAFTVTTNPKYAWYQRGLALMVYKCFDKTSGDTTIHTGTGVISEDQ